MYPSGQVETVSSKRTRELTSSNLKEKREALVEDRVRWTETSNQIKRAELEQQQLERKIARKQRSLFRFLYGAKIERLERESLEAEIRLSELREQQERFARASSLTFEGYSRDAHEALQDAFGELKGCHRMWDVTQRAHGQQYRSLASTLVERERISAGFEVLPYVHSSYKAMHIRNANGGDLYLYPTLLVVFDSESNFALISLSDVDVEFTRSAFQEEEAVPEDTETITHTWRYTNKDGSRDRRFSHNYQVPVVAYGNLHFSSSTGLNELYMFSGEDKARRFWETFADHKRLLREA